MDKDRLLTEQEQDDVYAKAIEHGRSGTEAVRKAQDAKTAAIVRAEVEAATLRAVGEMLDKMSDHGEVTVWLKRSEIDALRQGKMPEGWGQGC